MKFSNDLRNNLKALRTAMGDHVSRTNGGINRHQLRYAAQYGILFAEFSSPFGHHSLKAFLIGELDCPPSPARIQCIVDYLVEGLVAASRMNCPKGGVEVKLEIERQISVSGKSYIMPSFGGAIDNLW